MHQQRGSLSDDDTTFPEVMILIQQQLVEEVSRRACTHAAPSKDAARDDLSNLNSSPMKSNNLIVVTHLEDFELHLSNYRLTSIMRLQLLGLC